MNKRIVLLLPVLVLTAAVMAVVYLSGSDDPSSQTPSPTAVAEAVIPTATAGKTGRAVLSVSSAPSKPVTAPSAASGQQSPSLATGDGATLRLNADGTVAGVAVQGRSLPRLSGSGGFSIRMAGHNPNLIPNPGFEADVDGDGMPDGWRIDSQGATIPTLDTTTAHSGGRSFKLHNPTTATSRSFTTVIPVRPYTNYTFSAWFKTENLLPTAPPVGKSAVRVKVQQLSSTGVVGAHMAYGYTNTANWNRQFVGFRTLGTTRQVRISGYIQAGSGTAWIDDAYLGELLSRTPIPVRGTVSRGAEGNELVQNHSLPGEELAFKATYTPGKGHIRIDGAIEDIASENSPRSDKALRVTYTLPVNAVGWKWGDYARRSRTISGGTYLYNTIKLQQTSRYPFSTIYDDRSSLSIGVPLNQPRFFTTRYSTSGGFSITFDLGVSRAAAKLGSRATFSFIIYTSDPQWGYRAATQKYYDIYPDFFRRRTDPAREGMWFVRTYGWLPNAANDLGLGLHMLSLGTDHQQKNDTSGATQVRWDNENDIYSSAYNHHWAFYYGGDYAGGPPTYEEVIRRLGADARITPGDDPEERLRDEASAALASTASDFNGRLYYERYDRRFHAFYQNLDPDVSPSMDWAAAVQKHQVQRAIDLAGSSGGRLDGIHLDSTSGARRWAAVDNYNRQHWAVTDVPLTFSYDSGLVTQRGLFPMYEHVRRLKSYLESKGMILSANFNANEATAGGFYLADLIDYFGIEQGIQQRDKSARLVSVDSFAMLKRTMANQRPLSSLDEKIGDENLTLGQVEDRIEQSLFYGIWVGGREGDWNEAEKQAMYAKYTPVFQRLGAASWHPVTNARSSNPNVWLERFGTVARNDLRFTVRNETDTPQNYTLTADLNRDGVRTALGVRATEELTGSTLPVTLNGERTQAMISASIPARSTRVISLDVEPTGSRLP